MLFSPAWADPSCILNDRTNKAAGEAFTRSKDSKKSIVDALSSPSADITSDTSYKDRMVTPNIIDLNANPIACYLGDLTKLTHYVRELVEPAVRYLQRLPKDIAPEVKAKVDPEFRLEVKFLDYTHSLISKVGT